MNFNTGAFLRKRLGWLIKRMHGAASQREKRAGYYSGFPNMGGTAKVQY
jgi:hypothetical protein